QKTCILALYKKTWRTQILKGFSMKNIHNITLLITLITLGSTTFCMHTKLSVINRFKYNRTCTVNTALTYYDVQKGRRDAYQKWCATPIQWDNKDNKITTKEFPQNTNKKEDM